MENTQTINAVEITETEKKQFHCKYKRPFIEAAAYVGVFLVTALLFFLLKPHIEVLRKGAIAQAFIALSLGGCFAFVAYMGITKRLSAGKILFILLLVGLILRIGYMLYTPAAARQHDTYSKNMDGHEAYAWTIFETGKLPTTNRYQFYHPPLNAMMQAFFMRLTSGFTNILSSWFGLEEYFSSRFLYSKPAYIGEERYFLYQTCQILSVMYSFIAAVFMVKIINLFKFSKKVKLFLATFVILYPRQIQFSAMLNNDGLAYMLGIIAMYCALKWHKGNKHWGWIVCCALAVGFGMMTKLSSATVCLPIAGIFIYEFICTLRKKEGSMKLWKMILQYGAFLLVCAPIGLWFQVYAKIRFDQGFGFVFDNLNKKLYTGDHSWFSRFVVAFDLKEYLGTLYCKPFSGNYNLFNYALKSSIFGEFSYWQGEGLAMSAVLFAYMSALLLLISVVWCVVAYFRKRKKGINLLQKTGQSFSDLLFIGLLVASQVLSEIYFYIKMPYACTMDFRYIMPLILGMALTLGVVAKVLTADGGKWAVALKRWTFVSTTAFIAASTLFYCVCI